MKVRITFDVTLEQRMAMARERGDDKPLNYALVRDYLFLLVEGELDNLVHFTQSRAYGYEPLTPATAEREGEGNE